MKANRAVLVLIAIAIGVLISAVFMRGRSPVPDSPELPAVPVETE